MAGQVVLGIHSNALGSEGYTAGHAWVTVTRSGVTEYYGLWPDDHPATKSNGPGWDIRKGLEKHSRAKASRYYALSSSQQVILSRLLSANVTWRYTHNCSSWAHELIMAVVREDVDADDYLWFSETPRELGRNILILEASDPTSPSRPKTGKVDESSSLGGRT